MIRGLFVLFFALLFSPGASADTNLERIKAEVAEETRSFNSINERLTNLGSEIEKVKGQIAQFRQREKNLGGELESITLEKAQLDQEMLESNQRVNRIQEVLKKRIRSLYMNREDTLANQLSLAAEQPQFVRTAYYLKFVRDFDNTLIAKLQEELSVNETKKRELEKLIENQDLIRDLLVKQRKKVERELFRQKKLEESLTEEKARLEPVLTSLRAQALRLETVMLSYASGSVSRQSAKQKTVRAPSESSDEYKGKGLSNLKGKLVLPVKRKILRGFGKYKITGFKDMVRSKGVEFVSGGKEHVRAIAPGQVIFVGDLPGYDKVVIVNHGQRYYSLYGQLGRVLVDKGQSLAAGQALAVSFPDKTVYFEIRHKGEPVNPTLFYKLKKAS